MNLHWSGTVRRSCSVGPRSAVERTTPVWSHAFLIEEGNVMDWLSSSDGNLDSHFGDRDNNFNLIRFIAASFVTDVESKIEYWQGLENCLALVPTWALLYQDRVPTSDHWPDKCADIIDQYRGRAAVCHGKVDRIAQLCKALEAGVLFVRRCADLALHASAA